VHGALPIAFKASMAAYELLLYKKEPFLINLLFRSQPHGTEHSLLCILETSFVNFKT
jgi:hypothetical protein